MHSEDGLGGVEVKKFGNPWPKHCILPHIISVVGKITLFNYSCKVGYF